jgi:tRNA(adenine34) deaminase
MALIAGFAALSWRSPAAASAHAAFVAAAFRMKEEAVRAGDQPYGAVVVKDGHIVGYGPSRVVAKKEWTAHAEREAIRDAQRRLGSDLSGCVMYSTSRPCNDCERFAAAANVARMMYGQDAADAGAPRASFDPMQ